MRRTIALLLLILSACVYRDVEVAVPEVGTARSLAFATRDAEATTLTAYDLSEAPVHLTFAHAIYEPLEVAALLYDQSLAEQELPSGKIEIPEAPPPEEESRAFPFERGFTTVIDEGGGADWSPLIAVPDWLSQVRLPTLACPELTIETELFAGEGDRADALVGDGHSALLTTRGRDRPARYFAITADSITEIDPGLPAGFTPRDLAVRRDGRFVIAGVDDQRTELWIGSPSDGFTRTASLARVLGDLRIEVGRSAADEAEVYLVDALGEVLRYDGTGWSQLRAPKYEERGGRDRFNLAWVAPQTVIVLGPQEHGALEGRYLDLLSPSESIITDVGSDLSIFTVGYVPEIGTLAGSYTGAVFRLKPDHGWEEIANNDIYDFAVVSLVWFRGELTTGGSNGRIIFRRSEGPPCVATTGGSSLTRLVRIEDGLVSANVELDQDPLLTRIR